MSQYIVQVVQLTSSLAWTIHETRMAAAAYPFIEPLICSKFRAGLTGKKLARPGAIQATRYRLNGNQKPINDKRHNSDNY